MLDPLEEPLITLLTLQCILELALELQDYFLSLYLRLI